MDDYPGTKGGSGVWQWLINHVPPCEEFVEPFAGRMTVARKFNNPPPRRIGIEIDPITFEETRELIGGVQELSGLVTQNGASFREQFLATYGREPHQYTMLFQGCGIEWLEQLASQKSATAATDAEKCDVFRRVALIDPPYLIKSRRSGKRLYRHELTTKQHNRILTAIKKINASETAIIVCGYANELYDRRLRNWRTSTLKTTTRRGPATEKIWLNFPPPSRLQDHSFLGSNKRQRERLNRIRRNEVGKIKRKPPLERAAFFQMLREQFPAEFQTPGV